MHPLPDGDLSPLAVAAVQTFELYTAYINAGFKRTEALQIVIAMSSAGANRTVCSKCQEPTE